MKFQQRARDLLSRWNTSWVALGKALCLWAAEMQWEPRGGRRKGEGQPDAASQPLTSTNHKTEIKQSQATLTHLVIAPRAGFQQAQSVGRRAQGLLGLHGAQGSQRNGKVQPKFQKDEGTGRTEGRKLKKCGVVLTP